MRGGAGRRFVAAVYSWQAAAWRRLRARGGAVRVGWRLRSARFWYARGDLDEAARHGRHAVRLARRDPSPHAGLAVAAGLTMAAIERDRAAYAAGLDALAWAFEALLRLAPGDHERAAIRAWTLCADINRRTGRYGAAAAALDRARELVAAIRPAEPARLAELVMLEGVMAKELGDLDRAERCYATVADVHLRDGCEPAAAIALEHNLAGLAHARGRYEQAERHARRAVARRRTVVGPDQVALAEDLAVLAAAIAEQNRHDEARDLFGQALTICRSARPPRHYEIAVHLHNLASIEQTCGRLEAAERLYREALAIKERLLGAEHPELARLLNNLGTVLHDRQDDAQAAQCYRRALACADGAYPPEHPTTEAIRRNLAALPAE